MEPRQGIGNQAAASQEFLRQLQQAILLNQSLPHQQPLAVRSLQTASSQNARLTPVNTQAVNVVQISSGTEAYAAKESIPEYTYKVKIINPNKKSDVIVRHFNRFTSKFESVTEARIKLIEEFREQVPNTVDFAVGYFDGSQQAKTWLVTSDDLQTMYKKYPKGGNVSLWCDGRSAEKCDSAHAQKRKRDVDSSSSGTSRQEKEEEVESAYKELLEKHGSKYDTPRLRLWSRMITAGLHGDYDNPPNIPAFSGSTPKRPRRDSLSDAISGAAVAFAEAVKGKDKEKPATALPSGVSPGKSVELRMKNFEQLRYLQQLYDDGILTEDEYREQKRNIISSLRRL